MPAGEFAGVFLMNEVVCCLHLEEHHESWKINLPVNQMQMAKNSSENYGYYGAF